MNALAFWIVFGSLVAGLGGIAVAVAGLAMFVRDDRLGTGCPAGGSRRSPARQGWIDAWGDEGPAPRHFHHQGRSE